MYDMIWLKYKLFDRFLVVIFGATLTQSPISQEVCSQKFFLLCCNFFQYCEMSIYHIFQFNIPIVDLNVGVLKFCCSNLVIVVIVCLIKLFSNNVYNNIKKSNYMYRKGQSSRYKQLYPLFQPSNRTRNNIYSSSLISIIKTI